jgi:CBS domain-containing protein
MAGTSLGTLITYNPWSVGPTALVEDVAARFDELHVHHVPVVDPERKVIGLISETDVLRSRQAQRSVLVGANLSETDDAPSVFARDVMSRKVVSISPTTPFTDALKLIIDRHIHALPVVDGDRLVGLISSRDFLREFSYGELAGTREPISSLLKGKAPEMLEPDAGLDAALLAMNESGDSCLAVGQGGCPLGVISLRDIVREKCKAEAHGGSTGQGGKVTKVLRVTRSSPAIRSGQRLCEAAAAMIDHSLPAVTVVNQSNRLLGLITEDDLLKALYDALA